MPEPSANRQAMSGTLETERAEGATTGSTIRRGALGLLKLALTVAVTWFILDRLGVGFADLRDLDPEAWKPRWGLLALASVVLLATFLFAASLWGAMVGDLGGPHLSPWASIRVFFVANLARYVPGKVWQLAGLAYLGRTVGVQSAMSAGAAILCQVFALAGAAIVGTGALLAGSEEMRRLGYGALAAILAGVLISMVPPVHRRLEELWRRTAGRGLPGEVRIGALFTLRWIGLYLIVWVGQGVAFWLLARSFGQPGSLVTLGPAYAAAYLLGYLVFFAPAGLGVREGFLIAFLQPVVGAGGAGALSIIARLWSTVVEVAPAALVAAITLTRTEANRE
jgi:uncharacterized membrane protein YbhN (UPF0104 family)